MSLGLVLPSNLSFPDHFQDIASFILNQAVGEGLKIRLLAHLTSIACPEMTAEESLLLFTALWHKRGRDESDFLVLFRAWNQRTGPSVTSNYDILVHAWFQDWLDSLDCPLAVKRFVSFVGQYYAGNNQPTSSDQLLPPLLAGHSQEWEQVFETLFLFVALNSQNPAQQSFLGFVRFFTSTSAMAQLACLQVLRRHLPSWLRKNRFQLMYNLLYWLWTNEVLCESVFFELLGLMGRSVQKKDLTPYLSTIQSLVVTEVISNDHLSLVLPFERLESSDGWDKSTYSLICEFSPHLWHIEKALGLYFKAKRPRRGSHYSCGLPKFFTSCVADLGLLDNFAAFYLCQSQKERRGLVHTLVSFFQSLEFHYHYSTHSDQFFVISTLSRQLFQEETSKGIRALIVREVVKLMQNLSYLQPHVPSLLQLFLENDPLIAPEVGKLLEKHLLEDFHNKIYGRMSRAWLRDSVKLLVDCPLGRPITRDKLAAILARHLMNFVNEEHQDISEGEKQDLLEYINELALPQSLVEVVRATGGQFSPRAVRLLGTDVGKTPRPHIPLRHETSIPSNIPLPGRCAGCRRVMEERRCVCQKCGVLLCPTCQQEFVRQGVGCPGVLRGDTYHHFHP